MQFPIKSVLLEDEPTWRRKLNRELSAFQEIEIIGQAEGIDEAFELINEHRPKAAFMDIKLVGGNAFQLMDRLEKHHIPVPWVIMITGFPEYAVDVLNQYKDRVIKFLPKPVLEKWNEKLRDAVDALVLTVREESDKGYFIVKTENTIERIPYAELAWVEVAPGGRIYLVTDLNEYLTNTTLTQFLKDYPKAPLRQVSRNYAVNSARIKRIIRDERGVVIAYRGEDKFISIGDNYYNGLISDL